jgi:hypothetical protein
VSYFGLSEWRSGGKFDVRNEHQRLSSRRSWVRFPVSDREGDSLLQRRIPPVAPVSSYIALNSIF